MPETTLNDTAHQDSFGSVEGLVEKLAQRHAAKFADYPDDNERLPRIVLYRVNTTI